MEERMWNPLEEILVTSNVAGAAAPVGGGGMGGMGMGGAGSKALRNPVSHWRLTEKKIIAGQYEPLIVSIYIGC